MTKTTATKGIYTASVCGNKQIGASFFLLKLKLAGEGAKAFGDVRPGQFAEFDVSGVGTPGREQVPEELVGKAARQIILRRPFSFTNVEAAGSETIIEILYCVLGPATLRMKTLKAGDEISVIGPLGNGFEIIPNKKLAVLVAGGMGAPPLQHLAKELKKYPQMEVVVFAGAKSVGHLPYFDIKFDRVADGPAFVLEEFEKHNAKTMISTDDGSAGFKGFVTEMLAGWLEKRKASADDAIIYTCGPEVMMERVAAISGKFGIACQVSLERMMACGTGLCQGCAVKCVDSKTQEVGYKLCCKDGPVFWANEIVF